MFRPLDSTTFRNNQNILGPESSKTGTLQTQGTYLFLFYRNGHKRSATTANRTNWAKWSRCETHALEDGLTLISRIAYGHHWSSLKNYCFPSLYLSLSDRLQINILRKPIQLNSDEPIDNCFHSLLSSSALVDSIATKSLTDYRDRTPHQLAPSITRVDQSNVDVFRDLLDSV